MELSTTSTGRRRLANVQMEAMAASSTIGLFSRTKRQHQMMIHRTCTHRIIVVLLCIILSSVRTLALRSNNHVRSDLPPNAIDAGDHILLLPPSDALESHEEGHRGPTIYVYGTFPPAPHSFAPFPLSPGIYPIPQAPTPLAVPDNPPQASTTSLPSQSPPATPFPSPSPPTTPFPTPPPPTTMIPIPKPVFPPRTPAPGTTTSEEPTLLLPTMTPLVQMSVPFSFPTTTTDPMSLQDHLMNTLETTFADTPGVTLVGVHVDPNTTTGRALFVIDEDVVDWKDVSHQAHRTLETAVEEHSSSSVAPSLEGRRPSTVQIVIGFTLLFLTLLSLLFWAHVFYKKYRKQKRRRRLESLRQAQSIPAVMGGQPQTMDAATATQPPTLKSAPPSAVVHSTDTEVSSTFDDPFAVELQRAVSQDRAAWTEWQQQQQQQQQQVVAQDQGDDEKNRSTFSYPYGDEASTFHPYGTPLSSSASLLERSALFMETTPEHDDDNNDDDIPTSGAYREEEEVTTLATTDENVPDDDDDTSWPSSLTASMLQEVESIAKYVRQYEKKRHKLFTATTTATTLAPVRERTGARTALQRTENVPGGRLGITQRALGSSHNKISNDDRPRDDHLDEVPGYSLGPRDYPLRPSSGPVGVRQRQLWPEEAPSVVPSEDPIEEPTASVVDTVPSNNDDVYPDQELPNTSFQSSQHSRLSSLRSNDSILDHTVSSSEDFPFPVGRPRKRVSPRSGNQSFNNIRSIFEEKLTDPIVPPNDAWQYTGAQPTSGERNV